MTVESKSEDKELNIVELLKPKSQKDFEKLEQVMQQEKVVEIIQDECEEFAKDSHNVIEIEQLDGPMMLANEDGIEGEVEHILNKTEEAFETIDQEDMIYATTQIPMEIKKRVPVMDDDSNFSKMSLDLVDPNLLVTDKGFHTSCLVREICKVEGQHAYTEKEIGKMHFKLWYNYDDPFWVDSSFTLLSNFVGRQ